jgi:hypothetical protein
MNVCDCDINVSVQKDIRHHLHSYDTWDLTNNARIACQDLHKVFSCCMKLNRIKTETSV